MKNLLFLLFLTPFFAIANPTLDENNPTIESICNALKSGDVETLAKYFGDQVEISILDKEQVYSKTNAKTALKNFFDTAKPQGFISVHQGTSRENSDQYCIGNLTGASEKYRVYVYFKTVGNSVQIKELRFDKA